MYTFFDNISVLCKYFTRNENRGMEYHEWENQTSQSEGSRIMTTLYQHDANPHQTVDEDLRLQAHGIARASTPGVPFSCDELVSHGHTNTEALRAAATPTVVDPKAEW
jgi:hypothetical protein